MRKRAALSNLGRLTDRRFRRRELRRNPFETGVPSLSTLPHSLCDRLRGEIQWTQ
jgi:hypothetical protein